MKQLPTRALAALTIAVGVIMGAGTAANAANLAPKVNQMIPSNDGTMEIGSPRLRTIATDPEGGPVSVKFSIGFYGGATVASSGWINTDAQRGASWTVPASSIRAGNAYVWTATARDNAGLTATQTSFVWVFTNVKAPTGAVNYRTVIDTSSGPYWNTTTWNAGLTKTTKSWLVNNIANLPDPGTRAVGDCAPLPSRYASLGTLASGWGNPSTSSLRGASPQNVLFQTAIREIRAKEPQLLNELKIVGGVCYRRNNWSTSATAGVSQHSWGLAMDVQNYDAAGTLRYAPQTVRAEMALARLHEYLKAMGYVWGAEWKDPHHWEASQDTLNYWYFTGQLKKL